MQLGPPTRTTALRTRLSAAAAALLALGPGVAHADDAVPRWQVNASALGYTERNRTSVMEPYLRVTRLFPGGQTLSARLGIDTMTGATPSGAMPSGRIQTTTGPSGTVKIIPAGQVPLYPFRDQRYSLDLDWQKPLPAYITSALGVHLSREKDYQSVGVNSKLSVELMNRLTTVTVGAGLNRDSIFPVSGGDSEHGEHEEGDDDFRPSGLASSVAATTAEDVALGSLPTSTKRVTSWLGGVSRVLTRRWILGVTASSTREHGYLTEPYKVVSLLDEGGYTTGTTPEARPSARNRADVFTSSVYHLTDDVVYLSHRYYWDDWGIRSNTVDLKYRRELENSRYLQPHLRFYRQGPADFYSYGLRNNEPPPQFVSSDYRLGWLTTVTAGATYGFVIPKYPGEFSIRAEYIRQTGKARPRDAIGVQRQFDLVPPVGIGTVTFTYSIEF